MFSSIDVYSIKALPIALIKTFGSTDLCVPGAPAGLWWREKAGKRHDAQTNVYVQGVESIELEATLKAGKHEADTGDERLIITRQGTCDR